MTAETLKSELDAAVVALLFMVKEQTFNELSDNCRFILTEIKDAETNFDEQRRLRKLENDKKVPVPLDELIPTLQTLFNNLYDINLHVYLSSKDLTIIDIRYYAKSSLDEEFRQKVLTVPPMLHCKIANPPLHSDKSEKFDINWEHFS
jgi:hypothetical protein